MFRDFGEPAEWNGKAAFVFLDTPEVLALDGAMVSDQLEATLPATAWAGIKHGDTITAGGQEYRVAAVLRVDDGRLTRLRLET